MFNLKSSYEPAGDQGKAIRELTDKISTQEYQTLLGVTGSGKTFTMANLIKNIQRPALILSHNKTLAAQLYSEFKSFFPDNAVEYFISYYDYYLPEAYLPQTDTYIAKDSSINENIEKLRLSATASLIERNDVIVIASVSSIYGLGSPQDYEDMSIILNVDDKIERDVLLEKLINIQYERNDFSPEKGQFRVRGDSVEIYTAQNEEMVRIEFWGDEIEQISKCDVLTGEAMTVVEKALVFPKKLFVIPKEQLDLGCEAILDEMHTRVKEFEKQGLLVEAQRIYQRTRYDIEMMKEIGYCSGIENYSRHLGNRKPGVRPPCLLDFFPKDFVTFIDESHVTIPQVRAMYKADRSRKQTLVDHGFRLPSALDNRPLKFEEFEKLTGDTVFVSATPSNYELDLSINVTEQIIRPTGLLDPTIEIRPLTGQIDDIIAEIDLYAKRDERVIVTTLTKKNSERLADYLNDAGLKVKYLHSEIDAIKRVQIINELRKGEFDCLVGINLLREGLDIPEVSLVAILDADKEGFLRSSTALLQVAGRAARNSNGRVILYADKKTDSIKKLIQVSDRRRKLQEKYNKENGITPTTIKKEIGLTISDIVSPKKEVTEHCAGEEFGLYGVESDADFDDLIEELTNEMLAAAKNLEFERAADIRDQIKKMNIK